MSRLQKSRERAAKHLTKLHSGEKLSDQLDYEGCQSNDEEYQAEYKNMTYLLANMQGLAEDSDIAKWKEAPINEDEFISADFKGNKFNGMKKYLKLSVAASLLLFSVFMINQYGFFDKNSKLDVSQHFTQIGQTKKITLTDGSIITLNSGSLISVDFDEFRRLITLQRGEAYFDVSHDKQRPFTVNLGARSVTVLGTKFNLRRSPDEFTLAVTEGKVAIHLSGETLQENAPILTASKGETVELKSPKQHHVKAGWVAKFNVEENKLAGHVANNVARYQDWRDGMIAIDGEPLFEVVKELNRYSRKKIIIEDPDIIHLKMYGILRINKINKTLASLEKALPIKIIHDFDQITVTAHKK